jgi:hypothetical protein
LLFAMQPVANLMDGGLASSPNDLHDCSLQLSQIVECLFAHCVESPLKSLWLALLRSIVLRFVVVVNAKNPNCAKKFFGPVSDSVSPNQNDITLGPLLSGLTLSSIRI